MAHVKGTAPAGYRLSRAKRGKNVGQFVKMRTLHPNMVAKHAGTCKTEPSKGCSKGRYTGYHSSGKYKGHPCGRKRFSSRKPRCKR